MAPKGNLVYLETLRGLAAFVVVLSHLKLAFFPTPDPGIAFAGAYSVRLFFVLSGFVLSISFFRKGQKSVLISAALRRYPRLMLPACASILLAWAMIQAHAFRNPEAAAVMEQKSGSWLNREARAQLTGLQALEQGTFGTFFRYDESTTLNSSLWTMPIELAGSFFVFATLALTTFFSRRGWFYIAVAFALMIIHRRLGLYLLDFIAGIALCDLFVFRERSGHKRELPALLSFSLLLIGCVVGLEAAAWNIREGSLSSLGLNELMTLASVLVVGAAAFSSPLQNVLEHSSIAFLGKISFPLYLFHNAVIYSVGCGSYLFFRQAAFTHFQAGLCSSGLSILIAILVAWIAYYVVELPAIRASKLFANWCLLPFGPKGVA